MLRYHLFLEHDPETGHFTATVAGMPQIVVDASSEAEAIKLAREAILLVREEEPATTHAGEASIAARMVAVDV